MAKLKIPKRNDILGTKTIKKMTNDKYNILSKTSDKIVKNNNIDINLFKKYN